MQRFRNILVGIDLSNGDQFHDIELTPPNRQALRRAIWLAAHNRAQPTICTVLDISKHAERVLKDEINQARAGVEQAARDVLQRFVAEAAHENVSATATLRFGKPSEQLCRQALEAKHDLVIVGTRDLGRAGRILIGSSASKLLRTCPCPIWVARPDANWDDLNILVPSDFSETSLDALQIAVETGHLVDTRLHVLHVLEGQIHPPAWIAPKQQAVIESFVAAQFTEAKRKLQDQLAQTDHRTLKYGVQLHVQQGSPDEVLLKAIDDFHIDLVVMGTSARSGLLGMVIGNTAERLIAHMTCSVIAVKPAGFHCPFEPK